MTRVALAFVLLAFQQAPEAFAQEEPRGVTVVGEGMIEAVPDLATLTAGVQTEAPQAAAALAGAAETMRAVFAALEAAAIAPEDVRTSRISVDPLWAEGESGLPRVRGYVAANLVTIRVRDLERLGAVIDSVGGAGANRIDGVSFELAEPREPLDAARRRAVEDARAKAALLAEAAGARLGPALSIRELGAEGPGPLLARSEVAMDMPVAPGVVGLGARVEIVFAIE